MSYKPDLITGQGCIPIKGFRPEVKQETVEGEMQIPLDKLTEPMDPPRDQKPELRRPFPEPFNQETQDEAP